MLDFDLLKLFRDVGIFEESHFRFHAVSRPF